MIDWMGTSAAWLAKVKNRMRPVIGPHFLICHIDHSFAFGGCVNVPSMLRFVPVVSPLVVMFLSPKSLPRCGRCRPGSRRSCPVLGGSAFCVVLPLGSGFVTLRQTFV